MRLNFKTSEFFNQISNREQCVTTEPSFNLLQGNGGIKAAVFQGNGGIKAAVFQGNGGIKAAVFLLPTIVFHISYFRKLESSHENTH